MNNSFLYITILLLSGMVLSVRLHKLTPVAAITGGFFGFCIFLGVGFTGISMLAAFFIMGSLTTSWGISIKQQQGLAEHNKGRRTTGQVVANAGIAALLGLSGWLFPEKMLFFSMLMAATFSSATADTLSSELGNYYGSKYYNILSFKPDRKGRNGVVSVEGTLIGIAGSIAIALIWVAGFGWSIDFFWIILAGTAGNVADSILGATLERKGLLNNNSVNFLNTLIAAMIAGLLY